MSTLVSLIGTLKESLLSTGDTGIKKQAPTMELILLPLLGIAVTYIGYGPLSRKKNPATGIGFTLFGFLLRLAGPVFLVWAALLWLFVYSMTRPPA